MTLAEFIKRHNAPKVRKTWGPLNPVTRVKPSKKIYSRKKISKPNAAW